MKECKYRNERGRCTKHHTTTKCENYISSLKDFREEFSVCDIDESCQKESIFGNRYFKIGKEDIEALKEGKVLYYVDEYGTFIALKEEGDV